MGMDRKGGEIIRRTKIRRKIPSRSGEREARGDTFA